MTHIEEYYNKFLDYWAEDVNRAQQGLKYPQFVNREKVRNLPAYAFQPTLDAFIHLETELRKEFDQKLQNQQSLEEKLKKQQEEIDLLKQALADTLAALAAK
jgi:glutaredoxin 2